MNEWILVALIVLGLATIGVTALALRMKKGYKRDFDYRTLFILGICLLPLGITLDMPFFWVISIAYIGIGLANRDKWKQRKLSKEEQRINRIAVAVGIALLVVFVALFFALRYLVVQ